jgi:hypothetical protein
MSKYIYAGASWAARSYDTPAGLEDNYTNLAMEWDIPCYNISKRAQSNLMSLQRIVALNVTLPVIFILTDTVIDIWTDKDWQGVGKNFLETNDVHKIRQKMLTTFLIKLNAIGLPIGLIGSHVTITHADVAPYNNLSVIDQSWISFLSQETLGRRMNGWGSDLAHTVMSDTTLGHITPSKHIITEIYAQRDLVAEISMHKAGLMCGSHATAKGNKLYAKYLKERVTNFINANTKE